MPKMTVRVILKSGVEFSIKCDKFTLTRNGFQQVTGYNIEGITENKPVYLDFEQVAAVVRVFADEKPETDDTPEEKRLFTETPMQCPFCEGENSNARVYEDKQSKEYFVYCPKCGIETKDTFTSKAKAVKAFTEGKTKKVTGSGVGVSDCFTYPSADRHSIFSRLHLRESGNPLRARAATVHGRRRERRRSRALPFNGSYL